MALGWESRVFTTTWSRSLAHAYIEWPLVLHDSGVYTNYPIYCVWYKLLKHTLYILSNLKISKSSIFVLSNTKFMDTCSITIHFNIISACFAVFVECILCLDRELEEVSSFYFQLTPLNPMVSPNTEKLKRACIKFFWHFDTLNAWHWFHSVKKCSITFTDFPHALLALPSLNEIINVSVLHDQAITHVLS